MDKRGFVYVMTNRSMPGLVKVGMTKRVPTQRVNDDDMTSTGIPTTFEVQYYAFFDDMKGAEKETHERLNQFHQAKEFFKTDVATAICAIESINIPFKKLYSKPEDDAKAAKIRLEQEEERKRLTKIWQEQEEGRKREEARKRAEEKYKNKIEELLRIHEKKVLEKYDGLIELSCPKTPFITYFKLLIFIPLIVFISLFIAISEYDLLFFMSAYILPLLTLVSGGIVAISIKYLLGIRKKNSQKYKNLIIEREEELKLIKNTILSGKTFTECPRCYQKLRIPIDKKIIAHCPKCNKSFEIAT